MNRLISLRTQAPFIPHCREMGEEQTGIVPATLTRLVPQQHKTLATPLSSPPLLRNINLADKTSANNVSTTLPEMLVARHALIMHITVETRCVTEMRHLVMGNCDELVSFMRIQPVAHSTKMKVWLCLNRSAVNIITESIMRNLPSAEFGPITRA